MSAYLSFLSATKYWLFSLKTHFTPTVTYEIHLSSSWSPDRLEVGWAVLYFFVFCLDLDLCWWENTIPLFVVFHMYGMVTWRAKSLGCWDTMLYKHRSGVPSPDRLERGAGQFSAFLFSAWIWLLVPILLTPNLYFWWCHWHCAGLFGCLSSFCYSSHDIN